MHVILGDVLSRENKNTRSSQLLIFVLRLLNSVQRTSSRAEQGFSAGLSKLPQEVQITMGWPGVELRELKALCSVPVPAKISCMKYPMGVLPWTESCTCLWDSYCCHHRPGTGSVEQAGLARVPPACRTSQAPSHHRLHWC